MIDLCSHRCQGITDDKVSFVHVVVVARESSLAKNLRCFSRPLVLYLQTWLRSSDVAVRQAQVAVGSVAMAVTTIADVRIVELI